MKHIFKSTRFKILLILVISLFLVKGVAPSVFLANTPKINKNFIPGLLNMPRTIFLALQNITSKPSNKDAVNLSAIPLKKLSAGVYAGEIPNLKYIEMRYDEISWQEMELKTKSGKIFKIRFPKNNPPVKQILDIIQSE